MTIEDRIRVSVSKSLCVDIEKLKNETLFADDLGADSLDAIELIMEIEDEFMISIPDEEAVKIRSVGDAIKYIKANVKS